MAVEHVSERRSPRLSVSPCSAGPVLVVVIDGEADWVTADRLREELTAALAYGPQCMVLDLTDLTFCNLPGLRALEAVIETAEQAGVDVTVHGMSRQLTRLYDRFQVGAGAQGRRCRSGIPGSVLRGAPVGSGSDRVSIVEQWR